MVLRVHLEDPESSASLDSCLHCRANIVVYEHWACPLLLRKMSSDLSLRAQQGLYRQKGESHPWGWWVSAKGSGSQAVFAF